VDFRNAVIIMTSNLGTEFARKGGPLGFVTTSDPELVADHKKIERALRETFRPEFLNRIDEVIVFNPLTLEQVEHIVELQMHAVGERMGEQGLIVELTEPARKWLAEQGYDPQFGARPLRRAIQRYVESPLSVQVLKSIFKRGDVVTVDLNEDGSGLHFVKQEGAAFDLPEHVENEQSRRNDA
jgi:ATP-dependent Clp protease ATP-binding subunit ClpC